MALQIDIEKDLGDFCLKVCFEAGDETLALLGASGCGKSMTLRCIAGVETPDRGRIAVDGRVLYDSARGINLPPQERRTGLLFQNYALFPNMTVEQNIRAGARREGNPVLRRQAVADMMDSFGLTELAKHYPHQLSGGQQQRVALARILVSDPGILLLDEPFSALDSHLRFRLEQEVRQVIRRFGKTVLLVSHDRHEVYRMADSIAVMNAGKVETVGRKEAVYANPKTCSGAILTGCKNIAKAVVLDANHLQIPEWGVVLSVPAVPGDVAAVGIRSGSVCSGPGENAFLAQVTDVVENPFSQTVQVYLRLAENGGALAWELTREAWERIRSEQVEIHLPAESVMLLQN